MTEKKKKTIEKKDKQPEQKLLPFNPLMGSPVITPEGEVEQKVEMINEIETLAAINKQHLAVKRQQAELIVDNKKLDTAIKTADSIDKIIEVVAKADVLERVADNIETPYDMNQMAQAAERLSNTLNLLMKPNVMDEFGNKKRHKINFMFKSNGPVQVAAQVHVSDDD